MTVGSIIHRMRRVIIPLLFVWVCLPLGSVAQNCPAPQHELCDANRGTTEFQNCLARNRNEDVRHEQCLAEERRERQQEREEQEREDQERQEAAHERYCQQHPDASSCK